MTGRLSVTESPLRLITPRNSGDASFDEEAEEGLRLPRAGRKAFLFSASITPLRIRMRPRGILERRARHCSRSRGSFQLEAITLAVIADSCRQKQVVTTGFLTPV